MSKFETIYKIFGIKFITNKKYCFAVQSSAKISKNPGTIKRTVYNIE